jgi:SAM-dependent methyltransferase
MDIQEATAGFRSVDREDYPELESYSREEIYDGHCGPGGLYLAAKMAKTMDLKDGDIVLDLGCGRGATSMFLARHFGVKVVALDLWTSANDLNEKLVDRECRDSILPLNMDITKPLPFADGYFDAIFSMNSFSFLGGSVDFLRHLLKHLRQDGRLCVGSECFNEEFTPQEIESPPEVFAWELPSGDNVWDDDFSKQHSPVWWESLFRDSGLLEVLECGELEDGGILLEDAVLYDIEHNIDLDDAKRYIDQIIYGFENSPHQSIFIITARKR